MKNNDKKRCITKTFLYKVMKVYVFLLCFTLFKAFSSEVRAQSISLHVNNTELHKVFKEIENKSEYRFFYNNSIIDHSQRISINVNDEDLEKILIKLFESTEIDFEIVKKQIVLYHKKFKTVVNGVEVFTPKDEFIEQKLTLIDEVVKKAKMKVQNTISGNVTDDSGVLPGVSIIVKGTSVGTETDFDGNYEIPANIGDVLVFSFVGMKSTEVTIIDNNPVNILLVEDLNVLDEIIIVAYGSVKKSDYTGSATQIGVEQIENRSISNISSAIEGASAGVIVSSSSGQPGAGQSIRIRGYGSVSASSAPLYVVDGMPFYGSINSINPNDVESITVLKDASSTALYGNKAANGVIIITTKKGKVGKGEMSVRVSGGVVNRSIPEYDRLGPNKYYEMMWESMRNARAIPGVDTPTDVAAANAYASANIIDELGNNPYNVANDQIVGLDGKINSNANLLYADDMDWSDAVTRLGIRQNYDMSYQGGAEKMDYYVSLGYLTEKGYIENSDYNRVSGRANINFQASERIKTGFNLSAATSKGNQAQTGSSQSNSFRNPIRYTRGMGPIYPIHKHDPVTGAYILDENGNRIYELDDNRPAGANPGRHIVAEINWNEDLDEISTIGARAYLDVQIIQDLKLTINATLDQRHWYTTEFDNKLVGDGAPGGSASRSYNRRTSIGFNQLLNYNKSIGDHNFSVLLGHESVQTKVVDFEGSRTEQIADGNTELINFVNTTNLGSTADELTDESYFGRLNYDFKNKYFLSASYRTDGTSKFHRERRWGNFWSLGLSWRLDKEGFMNDLDWVDMLKIRGSYGEVGNNSGISWYAYQGLYDLDFNNQNEPGVRQATLAALDLEWEKSASSDFAVEFSLFSRLNGVIEFYNRESENLLFDVPLPLSSGVEDIPENIGTMYNRGIEISINYDIIKKDDFNWTVGVVATTIKNEFTKLPQEEIITGSKKLTVGKSIYDYWLRDWYGVDPADGQALFFANQEAIDNGGSDIRTIDGNQLTTKISNAEYNYVGSAIPDLTGAITNELRYKGFGLRFMFTYQIGGKTLDYNFRGLMSVGDYGNALSTEILGRWEKPGDITSIPRMDASETTNADGTSDRWLVDASYLNLKQVVFSYDLPTSFLEKIGISNSQVYINGENLFSINERKGMDIQQNFNGTTSNVYLPSKIVTLGININF